MRNHTATHILHAILREVLGDHVKQAGSLVAPDRLRFDFSHGAMLTSDQLNHVERLVNAAILADYPVEAAQEGYADAVSGGAMALFGEKYGDQVRMVYSHQQSLAQCREWLDTNLPHAERIAVSSNAEAARSIKDVADAAVTLMREQLGDTAIAVDVVPESLKVQADRTLLDQVLLNLLRNAVDALAETENPQITIRGRLDHGRVLLQIADNGPGMPDHVQDQVFVPFFTTKREGSGIGLSLSRQIMTAHGGDIAVRSDDTGTVVSLVFG